MLDVLSLTSVLFVVMALGYAAVRFGLFTPDQMGVLGRYVVSFALPALIFRAISQRDLAELLNAGYLGAYLIGSLGVFAFGYALSRAALACDSVGSTFNAMGMSCANSGFIGYPLLLMALPQTASTALALTMVVENIVMLPLVLVMAERSRGGDATGAELARKTARRVLLNPIAIAVLAGLAVSLSGLQLPRVIAEPVNLVAASSAAVSLVVIGGTLSGLKAGVLDPRVLPVVAGKLLLHPFAVWLALLAMAATGHGVGDRDLFAAAIVIACVPAMTVYPIFARSYGAGEEAALALLVMTAVSFVTITAVLWLLGLGG